MPTYNLEDLAVINPIQGVPNISQHPRYKFIFKRFKHNGTYVGDYVLATPFGFYEG